MATQSPYDRFLATKCAPTQYFANIKLDQLNLIKVPFDSKKNDDGSVKPQAVTGPKLLPGLRYKTKNPKNKSAAKSAAAPKKDEKMQWEFEYAPQGEKEGLTIVTCNARAGFCRAQTGNWKECPEGKSQEQFTKEALVAEQEFAISNEGYHESIKKDDGGSRAFDELSKFYQNAGERLVSLLMSKYSGESSVVETFKAQCLEAAVEERERTIKECEERLARARSRGVAEAGLTVFQEELDEVRKSNPMDKVTPKAVMERIIAAGKFKMHIELNQGKDGYASNFVHKSARPLFRQATPEEVAKGLDIPVKEPKDDDKKKLFKLDEILRKRQLMFNGVQMWTLPVKNVQTDEVVPSRLMAFDEMTGLFSHIIALGERLRPMIDYGPQSDMIGISTQVVIVFHALDKTKLDPVNPRKSYTVDVNKFNLSADIEKGMVSKLADGQQGSSSSSSSSNNSMFPPVSDTKWKNDADAEMASSSSSNSSSSSVEAARQAIKAATANPPTFASTKNPPHRPVTPSEYSRDNAEILSEYKQRVAEGDIPTFDAEEANSLTVPPTTPQKSSSQRSPLKRTRAELTMTSGGGEEDTGMAPPPSAKKQRRERR